jgi:hypothetical protein
VVVRGPVAVVDVDVPEWASELIEPDVAVVAAVPVDVDAARVEESVFVVDDVPLVDEGAVVEVDDAVEVLVPVAEVVPAVVWPVVVWPVVVWSVVVAAVPDWSAPVPLDASDEAADEPSDDASDEAADEAPASLPSAAAGTIVSSA